jgi:hypothetical protein
LATAVDELVSADGMAKLGFIAVRAVDAPDGRKHYGHLAPSFVADAIRAGAPRFGAQEEARVVPHRARL